MKKIVITGSTGSIGKALLSFLPQDVYEVHAICRQKPYSAKLATKISWHEVGDLAHCDLQKLGQIMDGADVLLHLAAKIQENTSAENSTTVKMSQNVAISSSQANVRKIILLSSISARLAEQNSEGARLYGYQKLEAEKCFLRANHDSQIVILRPPAVYGPDMKGALHSLIGIIRKSIPTPFGRANKPRDYISIGNLLCLLVHLIEHEPKDPIGENVKIYEPCDGYAVSTRNLVQMIANEQHVSARMLPIPLTLLALIGRVLGKGDLVDGAIAELNASGNSSLFSDYGWKPNEQMPFSLGFVGRRTFSNQ